MVAEQELTLRVLETGQEAEVRVVGEIGKEGEMYTYGLAFLNEALDFWRMEFPPAPASTTPAATPDTTFARSMGDWRDFATGAEC